MLKHATQALYRAGPYYLALTAGGLGGIVWPPPSVRDTTFSLVSLYFWLGSMIVGGMLCSLGRWNSATGPKLFGLFLVIIALTTYVIALVPGLPGSTVAIGLFASFDLLLVDRWKDTWKQRTRDVALGRLRSTRPDLASYVGHRVARLGHDGRSNRRRPVASREVQAAQRSASESSTERDPTPGPGIASPDGDGSSRSCSG